MCIVQSRLVRNILYKTLDNSGLVQNIEICILYTHGNIPYNTQDGHTHPRIIAS